MPRDFLEPAKDRYDVVVIGGITRGIGTSKLHRVMSD
jgi:hypothetical protein